MSLILGANAVGLDDISCLSTTKRQQLRRADDFIRLAVCATDALMCSLAPNTIDPTNTALFLSTCFGPMQCNFDVLDGLAENETISPTLFSHSVFNAAAGYISRSYQIGGGAWTTSSFGSPLLSCLVNAMACLNSRSCRWALVLQVECYSELLIDIKKQINEGYGYFWPPGATAFLLTNNTYDEAAGRFEEISFKSTPTDSHNYLKRKELIAINGEHEELYDPLALSRALCHVITQGELPTNTIVYSAPWGSATIKIRPARARKLL